MMRDYSSDQNPCSRWAFNSVHAVAFLSSEFPDVKTWTCWQPSGFHLRALNSLVEPGECASSSAGSWRWTSVTTPHPVVRYWNGEGKGRDKPVCWVGVRCVENGRGDRFLLFCYLDVDGTVGRKFMVSTDDRVLLHGFAEDLVRHFSPKKDDSVEIPVYGGRSIKLDVLADEKIVLPHEIVHDIEVQVFSFFEKEEDYRRLGLRHRRGFLFVGPPGVGKTMTVRHLIRECHRRYKASISTLAITRHLDESDLDGFFSEVGERTPGLVILEDIDSLTTECSISRSAFLSQLDGLATADGLLMIGTTNNPGKIDTALIHRPSRFDRVWRFPLPDYNLRVRYLMQAFEIVDSTVIETLAERTESWSFAYLNELRTTAAIVALNRGQDAISPKEIDEAFVMLDAQFQSGRKNHALENVDAVAGFNLGIR
jgi:hypothetical protein